MKLFAATLLVSTLLSFALWQGGLAFIISPNHPFLATLVLATAGSIAAQLMLSRRARKNVR